MYNQILFFIWSQTCTDVKVMGPRSKTKNKPKTRSHSSTIEWEREKLRRFIFTSVEIRDNIFPLFYETL